MKFTQTLLVTLMRGSVDKNSYSHEIIVSFYLRCFFMVIGVGFEVAIGVSVS